MRLTTLPLCWTLGGRSVAPAGANLSLERVRWDAGCRLDRIIVCFHQSHILTCLSHLRIGEQKGLHLNVMDICTFQTARYSAGLNREPGEQ
jgi:hypothetical protein